MIGPQLTGLSMGRPNIYAFHVENLRGPGLVMGLSCIVRLFPRKAQRQPEGAASSERLVASARRRHRRLAVPMEMEAAARSRVSAGARYRGCSWGGSVHSSPSRSPLTPSGTKCVAVGGGRGGVSPLGRNGCLRGSNGNPLIHDAFARWICILTMISLYEQGFWCGFPRRLMVFFWGTIAATVWTWTRYV